MELATTIFSLASLIVNITLLIYIHHMNDE